MAMIDIQELTYKDIHFCVYDCRFTQRLADNGVLTEISGDKTIQDIMESGDWHCPMITKKTKGSEKIIDIPPPKILYTSPTCPDDLREIMKLFNRSCVVLMWNDGDQMMSMSQEYEIIHKMENEVAHCHSYGMCQKKIYTIKVNEKEYRILYMTIETQSH